MRRYQNPARTVGIGRPIMHFHLIQTGVRPENGASSAPNLSTGVENAEPKNQTPGTSDSGALMQPPKIARGTRLRASRPGRIPGKLRGARNLAPRGKPRIPWRCKRVTREDPPAPQIVGLFAARC